MKVKEKLHSFFQFSLSHLHELPLLRLLLSLLLMMLDMLKLWLHWVLFNRMPTLFSGRSNPSMSELSSVSSTIIPMGIDCYSLYSLVFYWFLSWDYLLLFLLQNINIFATMRFYILCLPLSCWDIKGEYFIVMVFLLYLRFVLLRQKNGVFFVLDR
jgi:hypothetical protein